MSEREVMFLVFLAPGILALLLTAWARRGRSARARRWMTKPFEDWYATRIVLFGGPTCGLGLIAFSAIALPPQIFGLEFISSDVAGAATAVGGVLLVLLIFPLLYWILLFVPIPDLFYPPWAREIRRERRRFPQTSRSGYPNEPRGWPFH